MIEMVSILILLDYLLLLGNIGKLEIEAEGLNPYFIGLSTLIIPPFLSPSPRYSSQSLFYWITYSYIR